MGKAEDSGERLLKRRYRLASGVGLWERNPMTRKPISRAWKWSMVFGALFALFVFGVSLWSRLGLPDSFEPDYFEYIGGPLGAFISATYCWKLISKDTSQHWFFRGVFAAAVAAVFFYGVTYLLIAGYVSVTHVAFGWNEHAGVPFAELKNVLWGVGAFVMMANLLHGPIVVPFALVFGGLFSWLERRSCCRSFLHCRCDQL